MELAQSSDAKRAMYTRLTLIALSIVLVLKVCWFSRLGLGENRELVDFDAFHIAAQRVWLGDIDQAYQALKFAEMQRQANAGAGIFMPWTYPPQFDLMVAPLAFLPVGLAYLAFTATTLGFYLLTLRSIAGSYFALLLVVLFPALAVTVSSGQNGFLTGGLMGLACVAFSNRQVVAGLALGSMVIKPHLAVALAGYTLLTRRWMIALVAGTVVLASSLAATVLLGPGIWSAFLEGVRESGILLERGVYPLHRMISPYAALRSAGLLSWAALAAQGTVVTLSVAAIVFAIRSGFAPRSTLGLVAMVSVLTSPYAYDYDLPVLGIGLALLLPEIVQFGSERERATIYGLIFLAGISGLLQAYRLQLQDGSDYHEHRLLSISGVALVLAVLLVFRILLRSHRLNVAKIAATVTPS
ncbi:glycosyltransferase family 87 protein [Bradyrhizobium sp. CB82]|uniref:glycosyltransferase family 87 protein n=1 Tax=Bradyrhizobium sp. CB82 TaxID=3039159 RepID=UPI0024B173AB|nr:glycosyltransferase family 87 protein [Bradyrhizobium sp. CB82]WFU38812.1 glycosyltransferase family 87 protein [Bradyrhizobium sp. CB82]